MKKLIPFIDALLFGLILCGLLWSLKYSDQINQLILSFRWW